MGLKSKFTKITEKCIKYSFFYTIFLLQDKMFNKVGLTMYTDTLRGAPKMYYMYNKSRKYIQLYVPL